MCLFTVELGKRSCDWILMDSLSSEFNMKFKRINS